MATRLRRTEHEPRFEMTPLLDVIFLLLTFFILVWPMMVRAEVMRFQLSEVESGRPLTNQPMLVISIDGEGRLFLNREPITQAALAARLREAAGSDPVPPVHVVPERGPSKIDRLPILLSVVQTARDAGLDNVNVVGEPKRDDERLTE